jgi:hypothetical protein
MTPGGIGVANDNTIIGGTNVSIATIASLAALCALCAVPVLASDGAAVPTPRIDAAARAHAIDDVLRCVTIYYVDPDVAQKMEQAVRERQRQREYDGLDDPNALAEKLTGDLRAVSHDLHLGVHYSPDVLPPDAPDILAPAAEEMARMKEALARDNYGIAKVDILPGNVGYINFHYFAPPEMAADTVIAAVQHVADTDALILDLRECSGSLSTDALPLFCSYLFPRTTHLNSIYWRQHDKTIQYWTYGYVPGKRFVGKPVYALTSGRTFSGAEELAYDLKYMKRATIVGDVTGGGANPGGERRANDHFSLFVPNGRVINPVTGGNWEGTGVEPDVKVPALRALDLAHRAALEKLLTDATSDERRAALRTALADLEDRMKRAPQPKRVTFTLKGFPDAKEVAVAGTFNYWTLRTNRLARRGDAWVGEAEALQGRHRYKFVVDGRWIADPANPKTEGANGDSVLTVD